MIVVGGLSQMGALLVSLVIITLPAQRNRASLSVSSLSDFGSSIEDGLVDGRFAVGPSWRWFLVDGGASPVVGGGLPVLRRISAWGRLLYHDMRLRGASHGQAQLVQALAVVGESHRVHSPSTFSRPRSENPAKPSTALMTPKTGSTVCRRSL